MLKTENMKTTVETITEKQEILSVKIEKTDLKNDQNRKTEKPHECRLEYCLTIFHLPLTEKLSNTLPKNDKKPLKQR